MSKKPEIVVFAGPNGSGKSTITKLAKVIEPYINADDIKRSTMCTDLEAAQYAEKLRRNAVEQGISFTFETVLSTDRNLLLLEEAKRRGYFIRCIYVLTDNPQINIARIRGRKLSGGHDVPQEKVVSRYYKALALLPRLIDICDICHIYDNSDEQTRIFKKRKEETFLWPTELWPEERINQLLGR